MDYIIKRDDFIEFLKKRKDLSIDEKIKRLDEFDNIILCPYKGHKIDLSQLKEYQIRTEEFRCPECDEWIWWNRNLPWFQQYPHSLNSHMIHHPENYQCIANPKLENPDFKDNDLELMIWYDKNLNPIRPRKVPLNPEEKAIPLDKETYVAIKQ